MLAAVSALAATACLPLTGVFLGLDWARPVLSAALLAIGIAWACRRLGLGPASALTVSAVGWFGFVAIAFLGGTLAGGLVPTPRTLRAVAELWGRGMELARLQPSPTTAEPGLLLLSVTGAWMVAATAESMVFRLAAPVQAVIVALVWWVTPLVIAKPGSYAWGFAAAFLAAAAWLLLACAHADLAQWGRWVDEPQRSPRASKGAAIAVAAVSAGAVLGRLLPGATDPPWLQMRSPASATLASNPIVDLKARLVSQNTEPVLRVRSPRPVYLRITSLDVYHGQREEWTSAGIHGAPVSGPLPNPEQAPTAETVPVTVTVGNVGPGAVLVPAPYLPVSVSGPASEAFQYDPRVATLTLDHDVVLSPGDQYGVTAALPAPPGEAAGGAAVFHGGAEAQLPGGIPPQVGQLAQQISRRAGAVTPLEQALAIQGELRTWTYSLAPPPGHDGSAMASFLAAREGYCEQFAGTMAVMLRTLGIPARVAVGFTPGTPTASGEFVITNANAHAWVEARLPRLGWVTFEPTPRSDGNVLVPSATDLAPRLLQAQPPGSGAAGDLLRTAQPDQDRLPQQSPPADRPVSSATPAVQPQPSGRSPLRPPLGILLLGLAALAAVAAVAIRARGLRVRGATPTDRALRARARIERLGRGLGVYPSAAETDREYLDRLVAAGGVPDSLTARRAAGERLARATAAACYAPSATEADADAAERAAADLRRHLLSGLPGHRRVAVAALGEVRSALRAPLERMGRCSTRPALTRAGDGR